MKFDPSKIRALIHVATKRTGTPVHDEDLEQDVALRAVEAFHRIDEVLYPGALLMKIVYDTVRDHWRRRRPCEDLDGIEERFVAHRPAFESNLDRERRIVQLRRALDRLPPGKRALLESFYVDDQSIPEIAQAQGRSVSAVKMELVRTRRLLARIMKSLPRNP